MRRGGVNITKNQQNKPKYKKKEKLKGKKEKQEKTNHLRDRKLSCRLCRGRFGISRALSPIFWQLAQLSETDSL